MQNLGIYVHIPFCKRKCLYCDFCSHPPAENREIERYLNALMLNMQDFRAAAHGYTVDTVYIGGGTPSLLKKEQLRRLLTCIFDCFSVDKNAEISMEVNPGTVDKTYLKAAKKYGVNRISFGLQSTFDDELRALGRIHTYASFLDSYQAAQAVGFENINLDLMYGIPMQTAESFVTTLSRATELSPAHISVYGLKIEEGTPFYRMRDTLPLPDEETEYKMYLDAHTILCEAGYEHYEISNYAKAGMRSRHNLRYWKNQYYLGFGVAAHSYFGGQRYAYTKDMDAYISEMEVPRDMSSILSECTDIDVFTKETEYVMLGLRLFDGISFEDYRANFGADFMQKYGAKLKTYIDGGFMRADRRTCAFTQKGMYVSNYILSDILEF